MAFAVPIFNEGFAVPIFSEGIGGCKVILITQLRRVYKSRRTNYIPIYTTLHQTVKTTVLTCLSETRQNDRFEVFDIILKSFIRLQTFSKLAQRYIFGRADDRTTIT